MEIIEQINQICVETDNTWFPTHEFTKLALHDLKLNEQIVKENIDDYNKECTCCQEEGNCIRCEIDLNRWEELHNLGLQKGFTNIYNYEEEDYIKSKWIIPEKINGEIPGFILIKCCGGCFEDEGITHELVFACVRHKYRKQGILKNMVNNIPKEWNIWLEAQSNDIENVENIWAKFGFSYHSTIRKHLIYNKIGTEK
jgi:hypothetical protein